MKLLYLLLAGFNLHSIYKVAQSQMRAKAAGVVFSPLFRFFGTCTKFLCAAVSAWFLYRVIE